MARLEHYQEAIASYEKALEVESNSHQAWNNQGSVLCNLGRYEEAIISYEKALKIKPDKHEALSGKGNALCKLGCYDDALTSFDRALEFASSDPSLYYNKACTYALQNKIELVLENLRQSIELNPEEYRQFAKTDTDFDGIRHDPRFQAIIA